MEEDKPARGKPLNPTARAALKKEIEELLFTKGYNWNKTELGKKYQTTANAVRNITKEITDKAKYIDYEAMQILRLEKQRQFLLEELNYLRSKNKPRSHILRELRETEKSIAEERRKAGMSENKETHNIGFEGPMEFLVKVVENNKDESDR